MAEIDAPNANHSLQGTTATTCRSCGSSSIKVFLDLGLSPVANRLIPVGHTTDDERRYPLAVAFCSDCALVQLAFALPAEAIFDEAYPYYSSFAEQICRHAKDHADGLLATRQLGEGSLVVELASNDGYLLRNFVAAGVPVLGIDPSPGPAKAAEAIGVPTIVDFFGVRLATELVRDGRRADVIIGNNVMAHVPDLNDFVGGIALLLADDGLVTIENPYVRDLIDDVVYDTIYHEHYCYFSCTAVDHLVRRHGMFLNHVEYFDDLHGGTCRWHISKQEGRSPEAQAFLDEEQGRGMDTWAFYERFGERVRQANVDLKNLMVRLKEGGHTIAAYGAAAKGCTLLNSAGVGLEFIDVVVDKNVHKQGHLIPGVHIPIVDPSELLTRQPDYLLLLAWNFKDEIMRQQAEYAAGGGQFVLPLPTATILPRTGA